MFREQGIARKGVRERPRDTSQDECDVFHDPVRTAESRRAVRTLRPLFEDLRVSRKRIHEGDPEDAVILPGHRESPSPQGMACGATHGGMNGMPGCHGKNEEVMAGLDGVNCPEGAHGLETRGVDAVSMGRGRVQGVYLVGRCSDAVPGCI